MFRPILDSSAAFSRYTASTLLITFYCSSYTVFMQHWQMPIKVACEAASVLRRDVRSFAVCRILGHCQRLKQTEKHPLLVGSYFNKVHGSKQGIFRSAAPIWSYDKQTAAAAEADLSNTSDEQARRPHRYPLSAYCMTKNHYSPCLRRRNLDRRNVRILQCWSTTGLCSFSGEI